jgi:excinuclease UvrABC nuclease subunit
MSSTESGESWSQWLTYDKSNVSSIPERAGVFMMHASMKILFIGSTQNLKNSLLESLSTPCIDMAKRFRYMITESPDKVKTQLLKEYIEKHEGKLPLCMERI